MNNNHLLELKNVSVSFEGFLALDKLNISLRQGDLRSIIGPNGAGKTTFLDVITGKVKPTTGKVLFDGIPIIGNKEHNIARLGIGRKFQSPRVFENLTVEENLEISVSMGTSTLKLIANQINKEKDIEVEKLLNIINLTNSARIKAGSLSHGQKQWLEIAMLLGQKPALMLVDEPVAGLTDEETELTADLLRSLSGKNTVVVIDHDMDFIRRLDSDVTVLNQGKVLCEGKMEKIQNDPKVIEVYLGKQEDK